MCVCWTVTMTIILLFINSSNALALIISKKQNLSEIFVRVALFKQG